MKLLKYLSCFLCSLFFFSACEEVIVLDLEKAEKRVIIQAQLDATAMTATVSLTKSNGFYETTVPETISNANISLTSDDGQSYSFSESEAGVYVANDVLATPEQTFTISVESENETYTASTTTPYPVVLDSLSSDIIVSPFGGEEFISVSAHWLDLAEIQNFYRIRTFINDTLLADTYNLITDDFTDGEEMNSFIRNAFDEDDEVLVKLLNIDKKYYDYFFELSSVGGGSGDVTPFNPQGNFDNNALGFFGIYFVSEATISL